MQARNFTTKVPKIVDLKSSSEQIYILRKFTLGAPVFVNSLASITHLTHQKPINRIAGPRGKNFRNKELSNAQRC